MRRLALLCTAVFAVANSYAAHGTTIVLFADDFSNGAVGAAVSINDPDPQADPVNNLISHNTSLSGSVFASFAPGARAWHGDNAAGGTLEGEAGGTASWANGGAGSGTIAPRVDFATDRAFQFGKNFTVSIEGLNPVVGGNGTSANWTAISLFQPALPANGGGVDVNVATVPLGILLRDNGGFTIFSFGGGGDGAFDLDPTTNPDKTYDVDIEVTNISGFGPGNSFDYRVLVDGSQITSGTISGADTTHNYIGFEARSSSSIMSGVTISTVIPEPATVGVAALAVAMGVMGLRRRVRLAASQSE